METPLEPRRKDPERVRTGRLGALIVHARGRTNTRPARAAWEAALAAEFGITDDLDADERRRRMAAAVRVRMARGTGGTSIGSAKHDTTDANVGATMLTLNSAKGTESDNLDAAAAYLTQTPGAANGPFNPIYEWVADGKLWKPWRIPAGTANGIALKNNTGHAAATVIGHVIITEANF